MQKIEPATPVKVMGPKEEVVTPSVAAPAQNLNNGNSAEPNSTPTNSFRGKRGGRGGAGRGGPAGMGRGGGGNQGGGRGGGNQAGGRGAMNQAGGRGGAMNQAGGRGAMNQAGGRGGQNGNGRFMQKNNSGPGQQERKWDGENSNFNNGPPKQSEDRQLLEKLASLSNSTSDLAIRSFTETKFSGRSRLYVGNLGNDITENDLKEHFASYGEIAEVFLNKEKGFAFVRVDYKSNSEKAKRELDGKVLKGRTLRVRSAPHSAAIRVKNISPFVTNELLEKAFSIFGDIERAVVFANERGQSTLEGVVEFVRKPGAQAALRRCTDGCFFLTSSLRPVVVEPMEQLDDEDGFSERAFAKKTGEFLKERETGPRFADPNSFQFTYGQRWKQLLELYKQKTEAIERELKLEEEKLISQMEYARYEHETEMLREQLRQREQDRERQKRDWEMKERQHEETRIREEEVLRRQQEEMTHRLRQQEEDMRRRQQENTMFVQEQNNEPPINQQQDFRRPQQGGAPGFDRPMMGPGGPLNLMDLPMENKPFHNNSFEQRPLEPPPMFNNMGGRMDGPPRGPHINNGPPHGNGPPNPRWCRPNGPNDRDRDEFGPKRRRF